MSQGGKPKKKSRGVTAAFEDPTLQSLEGLDFDPDIPAAASGPPPSPSGAPATSPGGGPGSSHSAPARPSMPPPPPGIRPPSRPAAPRTPAPDSTAGDPHAVSLAEISTRPKIPWRLPNAGTVKRCAAAMVIGVVVAVVGAAIDRGMLPAPEFLRTTISDGFAALGYGGPRSGGKPVALLDPKDKDAVLAAIQSDDPAQIQSVFLLEANGGPRLNSKYLGWVLSQATHPAACLLLVRQLAGRPADDAEATAALRAHVEAGGPAAPSAQEALAGR